MRVLKIATRAIVGLAVSCGLMGAAFVGLALMGY
jgi:hypothetical protein